MKLSYKARYQKSESPKPFTVDVSFAREGISITYRDIQGNYNQQFWPKEEIKEVVSSVIIELQHKKEQLEITDQKAITEYKIYSKIGLKNTVAEHSLQKALC
jgi:hypothetical protein